MRTRRSPKKAEPPNTAAARPESGSEVNGAKDVRVTAQFAPPRPLAGMTLTSRIGRAAAAER